METLEAKDSALVGDSEAWSPGLQVLPNWHKVATETLGSKQHLWQQQLAALQRQLSLTALEPRVSGCPR